MRGYAWRMAGVRWLNDEEMRAWRSFISTSGDLLRAIERDLQQYGLDKGDYQLLAMLSDAPDHRMKLSELADVLRLTRGGLTRRMQGVVDSRLVATEKCAADGRVVYAHLTNTGFALLKKVAPKHVTSVRRLMIDLLTPSEIRAIGTAFSKISANLAAE